MILEQRRKKKLQIWRLFYRVKLKDSGWHGTLIKLVNQLQEIVLGRLKFSITTNPILLGRKAPSICTIRDLLKILCFLLSNPQSLLHVNVYFILGSSDGTVQIVDIRVGNPNQSQLLIRAHEQDVNVCDWNKIAQNLIVTGSDDCSVKVWDLRRQQKNNSKRTQE